MANLQKKYLSEKIAIGSNENVYVIQFCIFDKNVKPQGFENTKYVEKTRLNPFLSR